MIPASRFIIYFHTDSSTTDWGYKLVCSAEIGRVGDTSYLPSVSNRAGSSGGSDGARGVNSGDYGRPTPLTAPHRPLNTKLALADSYSYTSGNSGDAEGYSTGGIVELNSAPLYLGRPPAYIDDRLILRSTSWFISPFSPVYFFFFPRFISFVFFLG